MAHTRSAEKRVRQNDVRRKRNKARRSALRTELKKTAAVISSGNKDAAKAELTKAIKALDTAAGKGLIHKNQAARRKSRLSARLSALDKK